MPRDDAREAPGGQAGVTLESGTAQNTLYITSSSIGKVPEYNVSEDFSLYLERLEQYFIANFIDEDRRVAVLLTVIGPQTYKILRDLCDPILPKNKAYTDLCSLLKKQFSPQISVFRKRIEFYEARQKQGETINEWYARMKNLAVNCNFGNLLEPILKDKLVTGLTKGKILDRLCEEDEAKGIQELLELAVKREASMREQTVQSESVHRVTYKKFERRKGDRGASSFRYRGAEKEQPEKGREAEETVKVVGENLIWRRHLDQLIQGDREGEKGMNEDGEVVLENELDKNYLSDLDTKENCDTSNSVKDVIGNVNSDSESEVGARPRPRRIIKKPVKLD
ncbi:hypothetical protein NQ315_017561, partial [Exocentrus adspersus]